MITTMARIPRAALFDIHFSPVLPRPILTAPQMTHQQPATMRMKQDQMTSTNNPTASTHVVEPSAHYKGNGTTLDVLELGSPGTGFFIMGAWAAAVTITVCLSL
jgi:hypothetical protein